MHKNDIGSICNCVVSCHKARKKKGGGVARCSLRLNHTLTSVAADNISGYISGHILHHSSAAPF